MINTVFFTTNKLFLHRLFYIKPSLNIDIGDAMLLTIEGLQNLIRMPHGCGEQNMVDFAPDVYIAKYLQSRGNLDVSTMERIKTALVEGT